MTHGIIVRTKGFLGLNKACRAAAKRVMLRRKLAVEGLENRVVLDATYFALSGGSFSQDWSNAGLITANDDWANVPSIVGFLGQDIVTASAVDAQTATGTSVVANDIDVIANQTAPNTLTSGGVAEFAIANPVVAIQGSGTADVPYLQFHLNTSGRTAVRLQANLRDVDGSTDNSIQQINVQYRVGTTGVWTNVTGGYFADVSTGPSLATAVTPLDVTLPAATDNQIEVQLRVMTTNAVGSDEWIGIDDIVISSITLGADVTPPTLVSIDDGDVDNAVLISNVLTYTVSFNEDIDSTTLTAADFNNAGSAAITIGAIAETTPTSGVFTVQVTPTTAGDIILRIPTGAVIADVAGNALVVPVQDDTTVLVSATDTTPPTLLSIDDGDVDNLVAGGIALTYTVTFSEDIDAATVTASDFTNSGTSTIAIGAIVETTPGVFTVQVTPLTSGTLILQIPTGAVITDVAGNALVVPVLDNDTLTVDATAPTLTSIVDNVSGGPASQFQTITYTLTFTEDIDSASVTVADFDNAGTATISIGAIAETIATSGIFTVAVIPSTTGTVTLRVPSGAVISDVFGNALSVPVLDDTTITVNAITTLTAGDIAFTGIQTDAPDTFSFVLLKDVVVGTSITFTDNGWGSGSFANTTENTAIATFGSAYPAGTHFVISDATTSATFFLVGGTTVAGTVAGNLSGLSSSGDSILAFQGSVPTSDAATNWIAGVNTRSFAASPINTNQSNLPSALTVGTNAIQITTTTTDIDNNAYNKATFTGTIAEIRADVNNIANWTLNDALGPVSTTVFTVGTDVTPPTVTTIDDGDADNAVLVNTMLTYTITFNEDIDAGSVGTTDFDNAGSAAITIGTITETSNGVFTVQVTPTTTGTLVLRIPTGSVIQDVAGNSLAVPVSDNDTVTVTASDTTPPTVVSIDDGDADNIVITNVVLNYTITFSEDIDGLTVSASDFVNSGTSAITIGTIVETTPGVFTVPVTPTSAGTLILQIPVGAVVKDVAGNDLVVPVTDNDTITVNAPDVVPPTLVSITDNVSGGPVLQGQQITYTVTFSEDITAATVTAVDFDNSGTASISVGSIAEPTPGVFTVNVLATSAGTVTLRIPTGAVISDTSANNLVVPVLDDTTITVNLSTLTVGAIAFTAYQADNSMGAGGDFFEFVALTPIAAGQAIYFTDSAYQTTPGAFRTNETLLRWVAQSNVAAGAKISFTSTGGAGVPNTSEWTGINLVTGAFLTSATAASIGLSGAGDQVAAFVNPTFGGTDLLNGTAIAALNFGALTYPATLVGNTDNSLTALPPGLVDGVSAVSVGDFANGRYDPNAVGSTEIGTATIVGTSVNTDSNWENGATGTVFGTGGTTATFVINAGIISTIANRGVFYNGATGSSASANLATDKSALLPGGVESTFANYTSYSRGLNGVIVDISNLPATTTDAQILASLQFAQWDGISVFGFGALPGAAIPAATILPGSGAGGSARVRITFPDNTLQNTWLRVTVLANSQTALAANDVFYFGNVIGEMNVFNSPTRLRVNGQDVQAILSNQSPGANTAPVTNIYDVNRDGRVNGQDRIVLLGNQQAGGIVAPITVPSQPSAVPATQAGDGFTPATVISITSGIQNNPSRPEHGRISTSVFSVSSKIPPFVELAIRLEVAHAANLVPSFEAKQPDKSLSKLESLDLYFATL